MLRLAGTPAHYRKHLHQWELEFCSGYVKISIEL